MSLNWKQAHDTKYAEWKQAQTNTILHTTAEQKAILRYICTHIRCVHYFTAYSIKKIWYQVGATHTIPSSLCFFCYLWMKWREYMYIKREKKNKTRQSNWKPKLYRSYTLSLTAKERIQQQKKQHKEVKQRNKKEWAKRISKHFEVYLFLFHLEIVHEVAVSVKVFQTVAASKW